MTDIQEAKAQAKRLCSALTELGLGPLSSSQAKEAVARLYGHSSWQAFEAVGDVGTWNRVQVALYKCYPQADLLPLQLGQDFQNCGDTLFQALMDLAGAQPLSRVLKTMEVWADEADRLQTRVRQEMQDEATYAAIALPDRVDAAYRKHLVLELQDPDVTSWLELARRIEALRRDLYSVAAGLWRHADHVEDEVLLLPSQEGNGWAVAVKVPGGMTATQARIAAAEVINKLRERQSVSPDALFDYSEEELKVRLRQRGLIPLAVPFIGADWD